MRGTGTFTVPNLFAVFRTYTQARETLNNLQIMSFFMFWIDNIAIAYLIQQ